MVVRAALAAAILTGSTMAVCGVGRAGDAIVLASTTSVEHSGLLVGAALDAAAAMEAYTLSDRGSCLSFGNKRDLAVFVKGEPRLPNRYDVILLDPIKNPTAKREAALRLADWLTSPEGQVAIGAYEIDGEQLFHPSAAAPK